MSFQLVRERAEEMEAEQHRDAEAVLSALQLQLRGAEHDHHEDRGHHNHLHPGAALHLHGLPALPRPAHEQTRALLPGAAQRRH